MRRVPGRVIVACALATAVACGGGGGTPAPPAGPGPALAAPTNFRVALQRVEFTRNEVNFSWSGTAPSYRLTVGSATRLADVHTADVSGTSYTWAAPREEKLYFVRVVGVSGGETGAPSTELPVYTIDLRNVIDALYFRSGPMADIPGTAQSDPFAAVWADGSAISILFAPDTGEASRSNAQRFVDEYAAVVDGVITATATMSTDDFKSATLASVPPFTVYVRALLGGCTGTAIACAFFGPEPVGGNRSIVTINGSTVTQTGIAAVPHEIGHAYGLAHVHVNASVRQELNFMMNPALVSVQMTEPEKNAIAAARAGGIRPGWRRSQALAAGLVLPYTPSAAVSGVPTASTWTRANDRCRVDEAR